MYKLSIEAQDFAFEEELKFQPYDVKKWLRYLESKAHKGYQERYVLYERALSFMPRSYKLWYKYLSERVDECRDLCIIDRRVVETNNCFERSLMFMHKMPRIWMMYGEFLTWQRFTTRTRKMFDQSLMSLPLTQHASIWPLYIQFIKAIKVSETTMRVYRRYIKLFSENMEEYVDYMEKQGQWDEAAQRLVWIVNNESFISTKNKNKLQHWKHLCNILCHHAPDIKSLNVDSILRSGIRRYPQEVGYLWNMLAEYYTRCSLFEKAYDVYEEAISTITTVRDFTIVYDAYSQFLERMIEVKLELADEDEEEEANFENIFDIGSAMDLDLMSDRLDHLFNRREELLSSVKLRQNPHNIREWLNRVKIYLKRDDIEEASQVFATAVNTVDPFQCTGKYSTLWIDFAKFYENFAEKDDDHELEDSRDILKMAVKKQYKSYHDLANVWCEWVEMELRHRNYEEALKLIREAVHFPTPDQRMSDKMQDMLWKVERLWALRLDLEESLSNLKDVRQCYNDAMKLNVATVQNVLNFADTLWKNKYFEDAFRAYERGVHMFPYPHVMIIWKTYLKKFLGRHEDSGLERIRELFNQAILKSPPASKKDLYLMYAHLEEKRGLSRHVVRIYDEAVEKVSQEHQADMYRIYVKKVIELFGVTRAREIYEKAIQNLPDIFLPEFSLRYLKLECQLGEIDRARAIFIYGCQFANPTRYKDFWEEWKNFEVDNGNDETFREMLRMKRTIEAQNTNANVMGFISAGVQMGEDQSKKGEENSSGAKDAISELDAEMDERRAMVPDESKTE